MSIPTAIKMTDFRHHFNHDSVCLFFQPASFINGIVLELKNWIYVMLCDWDERKWVNILTIRSIKKSFESEINSMPSSTSSLPIFPVNP